jgi:hypothetical protein
MLTISERWIWMMNWCKSKGYPSAQSWAWNKAEEAYKQQREATHND